MDGMGRRDRPEPERLRRLRAKEALARVGGQHAPLGPAPERVGHGQGGGRGLRRGKRSTETVDQRPRHRRPRAVMDQHALGAGAVECRKARPDRGIAARAARDAQDAGRHQRVGAVEIIWVKDKDDGREPGGPERLERMRQHRPSGEHAPLLGQPPAGAGAAPGGNDDRADLHVISIGQLGAPRNHPAAITSAPRQAALHWHNAQKIGKSRKQRQGWPVISFSAQVPQAYRGREDRNLCTKGTHAAG